MILLDTFNATVLPHGAVIVFSGILAAAQTDDEIATVLGHEIAHVLAHHGEARISASGLAALTMIPTLPFILGALVVGELYVLAVPPMAVGTLVLLSLTRQQGTEADDMGMLLMTEAGFNPTAAESFGIKMAKVEQVSPGSWRWEGSSRVQVYASSCKCRDSVPVITLLTGCGA